MYNLFISLSIILSMVYSATLLGTVNFEGKTPKRKPLAMDADPVCGSAHKDAKALSEKFIVDKNNNLKNVLVWIHGPAVVDYKGDTLKEPAVIDQAGCVYKPHVQGIMKGQELLIKNSDATLHNIHSMAVINNQFNFAMPKVVKSKSTSFDKIEDPFYIKCDVHPWMKTWIGVFDHPFFATTDDSGYYKIENIPPGDYRVIAWHEYDAKYEGFKQLGRVSIKDDSDNKKISFTMKRGEKHKK